MPAIRRADATRYLRRGLLLLIIPTLFLLLELSWFVDPSLYQSVMDPLDSVRWVQAMLVISLMLFTLMGSACGLLVLQCGARNRAGAFLLVAGIAFIIALAALRPS